MPPNAPLSPHFRRFFPVFGLFFAERTQLIFFSTHSFQNTSGFFRWVRSSKTYFYREAAPTDPSSVVASTVPSRAAARRSRLPSNPSIKELAVSYPPGPPRPARLSIPDTCPPLAGRGTRKKLSLTTRRPPYSRGNRHDPLPEGEQGVGTPAFTAAIVRALSELPALEGHAPAWPH